MLLPQLLPPRHFPYHFRKKRASAKQLQDFYPPVLPCISRELNDEKFEPTSQRAFIYFCTRSKEWVCGDNYDRLGHLIFNEETGWLFRSYDYEASLSFDEAFHLAQQFFIP